MDLRNLGTFIQVAESGSFTKAGEILGYSQPTVSVQIKQLEEELGIKLFDRIGHTVRLTEKGREALLHAQQIFHMCSEMTRQSSGDELKGHIRLAMADSLGTTLFDRNYLTFREKYPGISLKVMTAGTGDMFSMLDHNEADIVCTLDSRIYNTNYIIAKETRVGVNFVVSTKNPLANQKTVRLEDLANQDFILTEKGMSYRRIMDEWLAKSSLEIKPILEIGKTEIICELVESGMGLSFLPDYVTQTAMDRGTIKRLKVSGFEPELWKQLLYHKEKWLSPQMQAVIGCLSEIL